MGTLIIGVVASACAVFIIGGFAWFLREVDTRGGGMAIIYPQMYARDRKEE